MNKYWFFLVLILAACQSPQQPSEDSGLPPRTVNVSAEPVQSPEVSEIGNRSAAEMVAAGFKRYGIEKGILIFRLDGAVNGMEMLYFDHWGWREAKYVQTLSDIGLYQEKTNVVHYLDGERRYEYDPASRVAHHFSSTQVQRSADKYGTRDMTEVGIEMIRKMGGEPDGYGEIQGVECEIWKLLYYRTRLWMWKGITMREKSAVTDLPVSRICISLETDKAVPVEKMTLPEGTRIVEVNK